MSVVFYGILFMKKVKYRNNNYNNQVYSINYKFDSISPAGKVCGTALDLIKKYNELAKEAQANGNYVEAEVFRQYAEHYRKIVTEINEKKNIRFNSKDSSQNTENNGENVPADSSENDNQEQVVENISPKVENSENQKENDLVETKVKSSKKSFKVIEVSDSDIKVKKTIKTRIKKNVVDAANE